MLVNLLLRTASVGILLLLLHQLFWSRGESKRHIVGGGITMACGALIVVLVAIRGAQQETMSLLYAIHLLAGGPFFIGLFATGVLGWKTRTNQQLSRAHRFVARTTLVLLILTLMIGVASRVSH